MVGLLGPEFLLAIALGQFSSARRSVRVAFSSSTNFCVRRETDDTCRNSGQTRLPKVCNGTLHTLFFTDIGAMSLTSPDYPEGFPTNAEQFHYLVKYGHVDFPDMEPMKIGERNAF